LEKALQRNADFLLLPDVFGAAKIIAVRSRHH